MHHGALATARTQERANGLLGYLRLNIGAINMVAPSPHFYSLGITGVGVPLPSLGMSLLAVRASMVPSSVCCGSTLALALLARAVLAEAGVGSLCLAGHTT